MAIAKEQLEFNEYLHDMFFRLGIKSIKTIGEIVSVRGFNQCYITWVQEDDQGKYVSWRGDYGIKKVYFKSLDYNEWLKYKGKHFDTPECLNSYRKENR